MKIIHPWNVGNSGNTTANAVIVSVYNKSGGSLAEGDVVIWDGANDNAVTLAAYNSLEKVAGVVKVGGDDNAVITLTTHGYAAKVLTDLAEGSGRGYYLRTHSDGKKAKNYASEGTGTFAICLTNADASAYVSAIIGLQAENY